MRLLEIHYQAFGPFTDLRLDLSGGREGLHILYGPNEAGKSSALRGLLALLFGMPQQSLDNFLHDYDKLRVGARLRRSDGAELVCVRRKGRKATLLKPDGKPLPEEALQPFLGGVTEHAFRMFFALNHAELLSGGQEILAGKGELGTSLFSAAVGGARLRKVVEDLERESRELFLPRGQGQKLNLALARYEEARREMRQASLSSVEWSSHLKAFETATAERERVRARLAERRAVCDRLERLRDILPKVAERQRLLERQQELGDAVLLRADFGEERWRAQQQLAEAATIEHQAQEELAGLDAELGRLTVDEQLLAEAETVHELYRRLGSYQKAAGDLPTLLARRRQAEEDAQALLKDLHPTLDLADLQRLLPTLPKRARIGELATRGQELITAAEAARKAIVKLETDESHLLMELGSLPSQRETGTLRAAIEAAQAHGRIEAELGKLRAELASLEAQCEVEQHRLGKGAGSLEVLEALPVPTEDTLARFESELLDLCRELKMAAAARSKLETELAEVERQLLELTFRGEVLTEADLESARRRRETGWRIIRRIWLEGAGVADEAAAFAPDQDLPTAYEASVRKADEVADRLRREAERVAACAALRSRQEMLSRELERLRLEQGRLEQRKMDVEAAWEAEWQAAGIRPLPPREMQSWLNRHAKLCEQVQRVRALRLQEKHLDEVVAASRAAIQRALEEVGETEPVAGLTLEALLSRARLVLARLEEVEKKRRDLAAKLDDIKSERREAETEEREAQRRLEDWQKEWAAALKDLQLPEGALPAQALAVVDRLEAITNKMSEAAGYAHRIEGIETDAERFRQDVQAFAKRVAPDLSTLAPERAVEGLRARLADSQQRAVRREALQSQRSLRARTLEDARRKMLASQAQLARLCQEARCESPDELPEAEARAEQAHRLRAEVDLIERQMLERGGGASLEQLLREAGSADREALPREIEAIRREIEELEASERELSEAIGAERNELKRMDGSARAAEAAEQAQSYLAQIRESAQQYLRLRLASLVLRREIERYREENQGPLLARAGEIFARLTLSSFTRLTSDFNERDEPILVGIRPSGQAVRVEGMSEGTRDQLHLALRLASIEKHLVAAEPLPVVLDDVLINFDDERAAAGLSVLAELSAKTQVLLFTHHKRLVEIGRAVCPSQAIVHELHTARSAAASDGFSAGNGPPRQDIDVLYPYR